MQPQDILPDGRQDLCDGCPNKTYHKGELVSACRKEEYIRFGGMVQLRKKEETKVSRRKYLNSARNGYSKIAGIMIGACVSIIFSIL